MEEEEKEEEEEEEEEEEKDSQYLSLFSLSVRRGGRNGLRLRSIDITFLPIYSRPK